MSHNNLGARDKSGKARFVQTSPPQFDQRGQRSKKPRFDRSFSAAQTPAQFRRELVALQKSPESSRALEALVEAILKFIALRPEARGPSQKISIGHRIAAILRVHCGTLKAPTREKLRALLRRQIASVREELALARSSTRMTDLQAAKLLGLEVGALRQMCQSPEVRRALGWPLPLGNMLLFLRTAIEAAALGGIMPDVSEQDPVPLYLWPEGWR